MRSEGDERDERRCTLLLLETCGVGASVVLVNGTGSGWSTRAGGRRRRRDGRRRAGTLDDDGGGGGDDDDDDDDCRPLADVMEAATLLPRDDFLLPITTTRLLALSSVDCSTALSVLLFALSSTRVDATVDV